MVLQLKYDREIAKTVKNYISHILMNVPYYVQFQMSIGINSDCILEQKLFTIFWSMEMIAHYICCQSRILLFVKQDDGLLVTSKTQQNMILDTMSWVRP